MGVRVNLVEKISMDVRPSLRLTLNLKPILFPILMRRLSQLHLLRLRNGLLRPPSPFPRFARLLQRRVLIFRVRETVRSEFGVGPACS